MALAAIANSRRCRYTYAPKRKQHQFLGSFRLLADPDHELASHLMKGKLDGFPMTAMDYSHAYGHGAAATVYHATVVVLTEGFDAVPSFVLYPRDWLDKLSDFIKGRPLTFSPSKAFNKTFAVVGDDVSRIDELFSGRLVKFCLEEPNLTIEIRRGMLLVYCYETIIGTPGYEEFLDLVADLTELLRKRIDDDDGDDDDDV